MTSGPEHYTMAEELLDRAKAHMLALIELSKDPQAAFDAEDQTGSLAMIGALYDLADTHARLADIALKVDQEHKRYPYEWRKVTAKEK